MFNCFALFAFIFLFSSQVFAVGFGHAILSSHLAEPLHIEVPLLLSDDENIGQINVSLASQQTYKNLKQVLPKSYAEIRVDIQNVSSKAPVVVISSQYAIYDPIVVLVLQAKRGRGVFYKSMQFFLDTTDTPQRIKEVSSTSTAKSKVSYGTGPSESAILSDAWSRHSRYGPVRDGDNLSEISYRLRKDKRWSNRQIILALYDKNPAAFEQTNINRLKKGSYLDVPNDVQVQAFVSSPRYQALKADLLIKKTKPLAKNTAPIAVPVAQQAVQQKTAFRGRISLGLDEKILPSIADSAMLKRLEQLEPMYKKVMATHLRMDTVMDERLNGLAQDVGQLHDEMDILALKTDNKIDADIGYGWLGFILLLILNVVLLGVYFYRKEMLVWQHKFIDMQKQLTQNNVLNNHTMRMYAPDTSLKQKNDAARVSEVVKGESTQDTSSIKANISSSERAARNKTIDENIKGLKPELNLMFKGEDTVIFRAKKEPIKAVDHATLFESFVHKKQWKDAGEAFDLMSAQDRERLHIQALLVQKMHGEGDLKGRNTTLLRLSRLYKHNQWHRFCSYFDNAVWHDLQDEKIISFTGKVVEEEIDRLNRELT